MTDWYTKAIKRLRGLGEPRKDRKERIFPGSGDWYPRNVEPETVRAAEAVLQTLRRGGYGEPDISRTDDGTIEIDLDTAAAFIEIEVCPPLPIYRPRKSGEKK